MRSTRSDSEVSGIHYAIPPDQNDALTSALAQFDDFTTEQWLSIQGLEDLSCVPTFQESPRDD